MRSVDVEVLTFTHEDNYRHCFHVSEGLRTDVGRVELRLQFVDLIVNRRQKLVGRYDDVSDHQDVEDQRT